MWSGCTTKICPEVPPPFPYKLRGTRRGELMVNPMTEHDVSKRLNVGVAWLRRRPRGSRGVALYDHSDPCCSDRHGQRPFGKSSYCMPWMALLGILMRRARRFNTQTATLLQNISAIFVVAAEPCSRLRKGTSRPVDSNTVGGLATERLNPDFEKYGRAYDC
jgi:hypothetical protein